VFASGAKPRPKEAAADGQIPAAAQGNEPAELSYFAAICLRYHNI
jgi:hypothetical protein